MLRLHASRDATQAKDYFTESLNRGDYYSEGQELAGRWGGKLAERLGLSGEVKQRDFFALCDNTIPKTGERLTPRKTDRRRVGYDINFHVPKSVSLVYALGVDRRILDAFRDSVAETMPELEAEMRTRVRVGGQDTDRATGNLIWAGFIHTTARPVGGIPDPHLHAHCFTFNVTHDPEEERFKAGEFEALKRKAPYFEARFHARMANRMKELGYDIRLKGKFWEIEGIPDKLVEQFSRRTNQINKLAAKYGVENDPEKKAGLGAATREPKNKADTFDDLRKEWKERAGDEGMNAIGSTKRRRGKSNQEEEPGKEDHGARDRGDEKADEGKESRGEGKPLSDAAKARAAKSSVDWAIAHTFERKSAVLERHLKECALKHALGRTSPKYVDAEFAKRSFVRRNFKGEDWITTKEVLAEEQEMIAFATETRGRCSRFVNGPYHLNDKVLNNGQRRAVRHVLNSYDQVMIIQGGAGTGKTKLMSETISAIERAGHKVLVLAPLSDTARQTLPKQGFKDAETIAGFLVKENLQKKFHGGVLWVDEAGLIGARTMNQLFQVAREQKCRVVLSGDRRQHKPVERGDGLDLLIEEGGMQSAQVNAIVRQKGEYKEACEHLNKGDIESAWKKLEELEFIKEVKGEYTNMSSQEKQSARATDIEVAHAQLAQEYIEALHERKSVLAVSPTHAEGAKVTGAVRKKLRQHGFIGKTDREFVKLKVADMTDAQKLQKDNYKKGMVIHFHGKTGGHKPNERAKVMGVKFGKVWVRGIAGVLTPLALKLGDGKKFTVYEQETVNLAVGDWIRVTRNGKTAGDLLGFLPDRRNPLRSAEQLEREIKKSLGLSKKTIRPDTKRLNNGSTHRILGFVPISGDIITHNGRIISKNYGHFTHNYCTTSPTAQSKGADVVIVAQTSMSFGKASNQEQALVSITRGIERCSIYTDDKVGLREQIEKSSARVSGSKIVREGEPSEAETARRYREHTGRGREEERSQEADRDHER